MSDMPDIPTPDIQPITMARALETLAKGIVEEEHGLLPWGSNHTYLISITEGDTTVMAVYKPQRGERPLWDFPEGTLCYREVATFLVSEALGWRIVPPTVLRGGPYGLGSVQLFVDHDPEINYFTPFPAACRAQLQRFAVFDYVINNTDRKGGHCLLDGQGHLWGIDHGVSFHYAPKLRTVIWDFAGQPLPQAIAQDLDALCEALDPPAAPLSRTLLTLLSERELAALRGRVHKLAAAGCFPQPGSGPNYPWPPV